jgi:hypothetical protein
MVDHELDLFRLSMVDHKLDLFHLSMMHRLDMIHHLRRMLPPHGVQHHGHVLQNRLHLVAR